MSENDVCEVTTGNVVSFLTTNNLSDWPQKLKFEACGRSSGQMSRLSEILRAKISD